MERIFVTYRPVKGTGGIAYHMSLNYIDSAGRHHIIDGGPENIPKTKPDKFFGTLREHNSNPAHNTDSPFKRLILHDENSPLIKKQKLDIYRNGEIVKSYTRIVEGSDLKEIWRKMAKTATNLNGIYEYRPSEQNSNAFVATVLRENGFKTKLGTPDVQIKSNPLLDDVNMSTEKEFKPPTFNIPGANTVPSHPISPESTIKKPPKPEKHPFDNFNSYLPKPLKTSSIPSRLNINQKYPNAGESTHKRVKLIATKPETPAEDIPEKGPERVDNDPFYNPLDFKNNGFEDLMGEVHLLKKNRKRFIEFAQTANRSNDFPLILEDA